MRARAEKNGYKNGTKFGSLTSQIKYDERVKRMFSMPTPTATMREDFERVERLKEKGATTTYSRANNPDGTGRHHGLLTYMGFYNLLPQPFLKTPCTADSYTDKMKSKGVSGTSGTLAQEIVNGYAAEHRGLILPTPTAIEGVKWTNTWNPNSQMRHRLNSSNGRLGGYKKSWNHKENKRQKKEETK